MTAQKRIRYVYEGPAYGPDDDGDYYMNAAHHPYLYVNYHGAPVPGVTVEVLHPPITFVDGDVIRYVEGGDLRLRSNGKWYTPQGFMVQDDRYYASDLRAGRVVRLVEAPAST